MRTLNDDSKWKEVFWENEELSELSQTKQDGFKKLIETISKAAKADDIELAETSRCYDEYLNRKRHYKICTWSIDYKIVEPLESISFIFFNNIAELNKLNSSSIMYSVKVKNGVLIIHTWHDIISKTKKENK